MKHRMIMALFALLIPMFSQAQTTATINPNDSLRYVMQLRSDSMRYAADVKKEELKIQAYKDSIVYSKMSKEDLYDIERAKASRYYRTTEENLLRPEVILTIVFFVCLLVIIYMVMAARERGKCRAHEYRMALLERGLQEKASVENVSCPQSSEIAKIKVNRAVYEDAPTTPFSSSIKDYLAVNTKYRRRGVLFIIAGVAVMVLCWAIAGFSSSWPLGWIPMFIGVSYLYLDYTSMEDKKRKLKAYQDYLSQEEKEQNSTTASTQCKEE